MLGSEEAEAETEILGQVISEGVLPGERREGGSPGRGLQLIPGGPVGD